MALSSLKAHQKIFWVINIVVINKILKFKSFDYDSINNLLSYVRDEYEDSSKSSLYFEIDKLRYVSLSSFFKCIFNKNCKLSLIIPITFRKVVKLLRLVLSGKCIIFSSNSDIVHIRNNLSILYLDSNIRIKLFINGGSRDVKDIINEICIRKKIQHKSQHLMTPQFLKSFNHGGMVGYMDRIVFGSTSSWNDHSSDYISQRLVDMILIHYGQQGVVWRQLRQDFPSLYNRISKTSKDNKINNILDKKIACSLIHGDLSLGNVIVDDKDDIYIIDWELSMFGPIVCDLLKIMTNKPFIIPEVKKFLNKESENNKQNGGNMASFNEQLSLAYFIRDNKILWK
jgi:hypothetical protein